MSEMIERVARVLEPIAWAALNAGDTLIRKKKREASIHKARLVIKAMRDPTDKMEKVGNEADCYSGECGACVVWPAMIDEALK